MKKTIAIVMLLIVVSTIIAGCIENKQTIKTLSGDVKISQGSGSGPDWCKAGTQITSTVQQGQGTFIIKGITMYQDKEVCESEWTYNEGTMTQYFNNDGTSTVAVMKDKTGKVIQEFNYTVPK